MLNVIHRLLDYFVFGAEDDLAQCTEAYRLSELCAQVLKENGQDVPVSSLKGDTLMQSLESLERQGFLVLGKTEKGGAARPSIQLLDLLEPPLLDLSFKTRLRFANFLGSAMPQPMRRKIMLSLYHRFSKEELAIIETHRERFAHEPGGRALQEALSRYFRHDR